MAKWSIFENEGLARGRQLFADQFEPDGRDFIYRKSLKGSPVRVSQEERDRFVNAYSKYQRRFMWMFTSGVIALIIGLVAYTSQSDMRLSDWLLWLGLLPLLVVFLVFHRWAWNMPARELRGRTPVGQERSRTEVRRLLLSRMTYGQLLAAIGAGAVLLLKVSSKENLFSGWSRLWLVFFAAIVVATAVQAYRKWRFESSKEKQ